MSAACLVIADESSEFPAALAYAAHLAKAGGWRLLMLHVIEPSEPAPWVTVSEEMQRQAQAGAEALLERFAGEAWAEAGVQAEGVIREGELRPELRRLIDNDHQIRLVVLAAAAGAGGPGPLVSSIAKGQGWASRAVPVMIVPGALSKEEIRALALPASPAPA
ncbi:MAG: universal stress protein [Hyphomonadaceae bacterium]